MTNGDWIHDTVLGGTLFRLRDTGLGPAARYGGYLNAKAADACLAHTQYFLDWFLFVSLCLAFLATPFGGGDISENKPVILGSALLSRIAAQPVKNAKGIFKPFVPRLQLNAKPYFALRRIEETMPCHWLDGTRFAALENLLLFLLVF